MILKAIAVDAEGNPLEDVHNMSPEELSSAFPLEDLMAIVQVIMPSPEDNDLGNAG